MSYSINTTNSDPWGHDCSWLIIDLTMRTLYYSHNYSDNLSSQIQSCVDKEVKHPENGQLIAGCYFQHWRLSKYLYSICLVLVKYIPKITLYSNWPHNLLMAYYELKFSCMLELFNSNFCSDISIDSLIFIHKARQPKILMMIGMILIVFLELCL